MEVKCVACGQLTTAPAESGRDQLAVTCRHCGSQFQVLIQSNIGAETELQSPDADHGDGEAPTHQMGSRTVILDSEESRATPRLETVVQGFLILVGAMPGEDRLPLAGAKTIVGRHGANIVIEDRSLSSRHFEVEVKGDEFFIRDLDSTNGTLVNDNTVRAAKLADGDTIRAGQTKFIFRTLKAIPLDGPS